MYSTFKFETAWLFDYSCEQVVSEVWSESAGISVMQKLCLTGQKLKCWSNGTFDKLGKHIEEAEKL